MIAGRTATATLGSSSSSTGEQTIEWSSSDPSQSDKPNEWNSQSSFVPFQSDQSTEWDIQSSFVPSQSDQSTEWDIQSSLIPSQSDQITEYSTESSLVPSQSDQITEWSSQSSLHPFQASSTEYPKTDSAHSDTILLVDNTLTTPPSSATVRTETSISTASPVPATQTGEISNVVALLEETQTQILLAVTLVAGILACIVLWLLVERRRRAKKLEALNKLRAEQTTKTATTTRTKAKHKHKKKKTKRKKRKRRKKPAPTVKPSSKLRKALSDFLEGQTQSIASEWNEIEDDKPSSKPTQTSKTQTKQLTV